MTGNKILAQIYFKLGARLISDFLANLLTKIKRRLALDLF